MKQLLTITFKDSLPRFGVATPKVPRVANPSIARIYFSRTASQPRTWMHRTGNL